MTPWCASLAWAVQCLRVEQSDGRSACLVAGGECRLLHALDVLYVFCLSWVVSVLLALANVAVVGATFSAYFWQCVFCTYPGMLDEGTGDPR